MTSGERVGDVSYAIAALEGWDAAGLKQLASAVASKPRQGAILLSLPPPSALVVAHAPGVGVDSGAVLKRMVARFGGKGGGRPELAQGGGLEGSVEEMLAFARATVREALGAS